MFLRNRLENGRNEYFLPALLSPLFAKAGGIMTKNNKQENPMSENIYGIHAVNSILANSPERLIEVFVLKGREDKRLQPLLTELYALGIAVQFVNRQTLDKKIQR